MFEKEKIKEILDTFLKEKGYVLFNLRWVQTHNRYLLRIYVDREEGGITIDECTSLNDEISLLLDREMDIMSSYVLEVSSPGMDWPLKTPRDWKRVLNQDIEVLFADSRKIEGKLVAVEDDSIVLDIKDQGESVIKLDDIVKAKQKIA